MSTPETEIQENKPARPKPVVTVPVWQPKGRRLVGCRAYPTKGYLAGAPVTWCRSSQGEWCGKCQHRGA